MKRPNPNCPVAKDSARLSALSKDMLRAMRRLRRDLNACRGCTCAEDCLVLQNFNSQVQIVLQEITDEWNLTTLISGE
jgi:hypothetical protein